MNNVYQSSAGKFTVREVEERTGVPASSLRQWERRYGFPTPERSPSGYRYYSERDVEGIMRMRDLVADGVAASRAATMVAESQVSASGVRSAAVLADELRGALVALDAERAEAVYSEALALYPVHLVMLEVVRPALVRVGDMWHAGEVNVATEHFASSFLQGRVRSLFRLMTGAGRGHRVVVACAPGERHEIGSLILSVMLKRAGFQVAYLGADTPIADLADMVRREGFEAVLLSATSEEAHAALRAARSQLREMPALLVLGGAALERNPELAAESGGVFLGNDVRKVVPELEALLAKAAGRRRS